MAYGLLIINIDADCALTIGRWRGPEAGWSFQDIQRGPGFGGDKRKAVYNDRNLLIIPCDTAVIGGIENFIDMQKLLFSAEHAEKAQAQRKNIRGYNGPYYFSINMKPDAEYDAGERAHATIGGPLTAYANALEARNTDYDRVYADVSHRMHNVFHRMARAVGLAQFNWDEDDIKRCIEKREKKLEVKDQIPFARYNCWTGAQGISQYIGGIDLADIHPELPYVFRAAQAEGLLHRLEKEIEDDENEQYTVHKTRSKKFTLAQQGNNPPFMITRYNEDTILPHALNVRLKNGESVHDYLERLSREGGLFQARPAHQHEHVVTKGLMQPDLEPDL